MTVWNGVRLLTAVGVLALAAGQAATTQARHRNVIVFVADGMRHGSVNARDTPALWRVRSEGVHFDNSHALFPTVTMANGSAIATGHGLGDTGAFGNMLWTGYQTFDSGNFGLGAGSPVPFIENDQIVADLHAHFGGNVLGENTLLDAAARHGYKTAAVGKLGPVGLQAPAAIAAASGRFPPPGATIIVDDATGTANGPALPKELARLLAQEHLAPEAPTRSNGYGPNSTYDNAYFGTRARPGTLAANVVQQQWLADVTTRGILPLFARDPGEPFALVFWARDPDGTQHYQGDSLGTLTPGINGPTSLEAVRNADRALAQLLAWLDAHPAVKENTDLFVTSDHGFATISRREIDRTGRTTASVAAMHDYVDANGTVDTVKGTLPTGFLAIDLSLELHMGLFDPERRTDTGPPSYRRVQLTVDPWEHPVSGNGLIGTDVQKADGSDATAIVAANEGSDLIYVPDGNADTVRRIVGLLLGHDYVGGLFVDDRYGEIPGTLPFSAVGLMGSATVPRPAIVVAFKVFYLDPDDLRTAVQIADTRQGLQEGQGTHSGLGRDSTFNNMAAIGPDFKRGVVDHSPVGNADVAPTLASVMAIALAPKGALQGRILREALAHGPDAPAARTGRQRSAVVNGRQLLLEYQQLGTSRYVDFACVVTEDQRSPTCR